MSTANFFISRAGENAAIAVQIASILREAGYSTFIQDQDFGNTNFMAKMADGFAMVDQGARVIAVLSPHYHRKPHCMVEAHYPLTDDPANRRERLIVLRIADCQSEGHLKGIPFVDLVPWLLDAEGFKRAVLSAVAPRSERQVQTKGRVLHPEIRAVPGFVGREDELAAIEAALWKKGGKAALTATSAAVKGMGGVGKSVLAQEYAWRNHERYEGVWWIRAETSETMLDDLIELGSKFLRGISEAPDRTKAAQAALSHIAQKANGKPWLLIYDNVESPAQIDNLTPASSAHVLVTTRWQDWYGHAEDVPVDVFERDLAVRFLLDATRHTDHEAAGRLADGLGRLPLALDHAAAYMRRAGIDFDTYGRLAADLLQKAPKGVGYAKPVFATFELAASKAVEACSEAEKLIGIAAFLAPDRIPLDIITSGVMSEMEKGEAVAALAEVSLVTQETLDDGSPGISVHRLVQQVMRGRLGELATDMAALATAVVADAYPAGDLGPDDVRSWPACRRLESHTAAVLPSAPVEGDKAQKTVLLLNKYAQHLNARAEFAAAEPLMRRALSIDEARFGPHHPNVAIDLNNLAGLLQDTNRLMEAEPLIKRALSIDESNFGSDHPDVARDLNNLAALLQATNRLGEAEPLMRRALAIDEASFGPDHPNVAIDLNNLAQLLQATNRLGEAEPLIRRALSIDEPSLGPDHPSVGIRVGNLAGLLSDLGRLDEVEPLRRRELQIMERGLPEGHPHIATALNNLAQLLKATNRLAEAEPLMRRALSIDESSFGPDHPNVGRDLNNLAQLLRATNRLTEAEPLMRRALSIDESSFGSDHPDVARDLNNLAHLLKATNRLGEAEPLTRRALSIFEASLGADHPSSKTVRKNLNVLLSALAASTVSGPAMATSVKPVAPANSGTPKRGLLARLFGG